MFLLLNTTLIFSHVAEDGINLTFFPVIRALNAFMLILSKWNLWFKLHVEFVSAAEEAEGGG